MADAETVCGALHTAREKVNIVPMAHCMNGIPRYMPMEPGESPLNCARRELEEETGLVAREFVELSHVYIIPAYSDEKIHVYLARGFTTSEQNLDQDEIIQVEEYPLKEVLQMISQGLITDALTILSIQQAHMYIQEGL